MSQRIGWVTVVFAACGWLFLWNAISTHNIFCGGGPDPCPSLVAIVPRYAALAGMGLSAVAIAIALNRERVAARWIRIGAVVTAGIGFFLLLVAIVGEYDAIVSSWSSGRLDREYRPPALPDVIRSVSSTLWPVFIAGWMTLVSIRLGQLGLPVVIAGLGVVAGMAVVITVPYTQEYFVHTSIMPLELIVSLVWATAVGVHLTTAARTSART